MKITALQNIMVSIGLKTASAGDLLNAGFTRIFRTKAEQAALTALYAEKAASSTPSLDVNRLHRTDGAGNLQADGGYLIFTAEGQKTVTPQNLVADLTKFGFHLSVVELFQAEGNEEHLKLRVTWSRNGQAFTTLNADQAGLLRRYFDLAYWKLFGFFNPEAVSLEGNESPIGTVAN